jgi:transposase-like protein
VKGRWTYLYRAVDKQGRTVDFLLSERRDVAAAKRFFSKAMKKHGTPRVITLDAYAASHRAITELQSAGTLARRVVIRSSKYLNNVWSKIIATSNSEFGRCLGSGDLRQRR